jgi:hypothetical protein
MSQIDDLLEQYKKQQQEVYINNTPAAICKLGYIARNLASAYEEKFRSDPTYKNEERMRYWRYSAAEYFFSAREPGEFYPLYHEKEFRKKEYLRVLRRHGQLEGGYADQSITNGVEVYSSMEEVVRNYIQFSLDVCEERQSLARFFEYPNGRIVATSLLLVGSEHQKKLTDLSREHFRAGDNYEKHLQNAVRLAREAQERGVALALIAELQRILHRPNETGETLLKLHQKGNLRIFVNLRGDSGRWLFGDRKGPYWPSAHASMTEAQHALNRTMQPFSVDVASRMLTQYFGKHLHPRAGTPGAYQVNTSRLPSAWDVTEELNSLIREFNSFQKELLMKLSDTRRQSIHALADAVCDTTYAALNQLQG